MTRAGRAGAVLLLAWATVAAAEERFYPVVGPDGRIEMLRSPAVKEGAKAAPAPGKAAPAGAAAADGAVEGTATGAASPAPELPHAAYDSDEYVDSEAMDAATQPAAGGKRRFYTIDDGLGARTKESDGDGAAMPPAPPMPRTAPLPERWEPVATERRRWRGDEVAPAMPWLPRCVDLAWLRQRPLLGTAVSSGFVVGKQDYAFLAPGRILAGWKLEEGALRTLVLRSYSRKSRAPAFLDPRLAFLDAGGCVTRVEQGAFERRYAGTDQLHAFLWGEMLVHAGDAWMLLLAPPEDEKSAGAASWQSSRVGQLKFTLQK